MAEARQSSLTTRMIGSLAVIFVIGCVSFGFIVAQRTGRDVRVGLRDVVKANSRHYDTLFEEDARSQSELLEHSVRQLSSRIGAEVADVPFGLFAGREDLLLAFFKRRFEEAQQRHIDNSAVVASIYRAGAVERSRIRREEIDRLQTERAEELSKRVFRDLLAWSGIFLLGMSGGVGLVFWRLVLTPLKSAVSVMDRIRGGERARRIPERGADEIARLASSFNAMADENETYRSHLEGRVEEKTRESSLALERQRAASERAVLALAELERTQLRLVESAKMAALGTMAQGMAHEFNNIIGGIRGCAQSLRDEIVDPESRDVLDVIARAAQRASLITDNLLRFSRGGLGVRSETSLVEVIDTAISLVGADATRGQTEIEFNERVDAKVVGDPAGLQQVFLNLILNAVQASGGGRVRVGVERSVDAWLVSVTDDGCGIHADVLPRIFEPFFTTKKPSAVSGRGGTGLGLAVSQGIMHEMGGEIVAHSDGLGKGARFTVTVPLKAKRHE